MTSKKKIIRSIKEWFLEKGNMDSESIRQGKCSDTYDTNYFYRLNYGCAEYRDKDPIVAKKMAYDLFSWLEGELGIGNLFAEDVENIFQQLKKDAGVNEQGV